MSGKVVRVGLGTCGIAAGAQEVWDFLAGNLPPGASLKRTSCCGLCHKEPLVEVAEDGKRTLYGPVDLKGARKIAAQHLAGGAPVAELAIDPYAPEGNSPGFFARQKKIVLENAGVIDPESLEEARAAGAYLALARALDLAPQKVIELVERSGLRGRGGAGFPTGRKWLLARQAAGSPKYVICNADEGDPGAFMDRATIEGDPHRVLEGMIIAAWAIGASEGYVYVRAEYPLAVKRLRLALKQAEEAGFLGPRVAGRDFACRIQVREGAGAFVCGEETALIASLEGRRGMPRLRPPFPAQAGLWGKPTNINNVETLANVPWIILNGPAAFAAMGVGQSRGTKVFALAGNVRRGGLIEVPMGLTLREVILEIGGGTASGRPFKAVQLGGPSGGCIPAALAETPVDYEAITATGAIMGSGGMVVMDEGACLVDVARFFLDFTQKESCGKCTFCRVGTRRMLEILERICAGKGREEDLGRLGDLAQAVRRTSLCGLGQTAPNPVLTTLKYFRGEYEAHIRDRKCPAGVCKALITYKIKAEACTGCAACVKACPVAAISGEKKKPHAIDAAKCLRCGFCREACREGAILVE